jgi:hypothetical protein
MVERLLEKWTVGMLLEMAGILLEFHQDLEYYARSL